MNITPIDMVLHCPACGLQHIDEPELVSKIFACHHADPMACSCDNRRWTNPPHRSHLCADCGHIWRPADVPTNGVAAVTTKGKSDSQITQPPITKLLDFYYAYRRLMGLLGQPGCTAADEVAAETAFESASAAIATDAKIFGRTK